MTISELSIKSFGKINDKKISFTNGVNVLVGENESGKSTIFAFIRALFYGLDGRGTDNARKKYTPWKLNNSDIIDSAVFGGTMHFEHNGLKYRIDGIFGISRRNDSVKLYNDVSGVEIIIPDTLTIGEYILELTSGAFDCSFYAGQLASKIDFSRDKTGMLITKLSTASGYYTNESSFAETEKILKNSMDSIKAPRSGNGTLDKLYEKNEKLTNAFIQMQAFDEKASAYSDSKDKLILEEKKLIEKVLRYEMFISLRKGHDVILRYENIVKKCKLIDMLHNKLDNFMSDNLKDTLEGLYSDSYQSIYNKCVKQKKKENRTNVFLTFLIFLFFFATAGSATYIYLKNIADMMIISLFYGLSAVFLTLGFILAFRTASKRKATAGISNIDDFQLAVNELDKQEALLEQMLNNDTLKDVENAKQKAIQYANASGVDNETYSKIKLCSIESLILKKDEADLALRERQNLLVSINASIETLYNMKDSTTEYSYEYVYEQLPQVKQDIAKYEKKYNALSITRSVLSEAFDEVQASFGPALNDETGFITSMLTGGNYNCVKVSRDFDISILNSDITPHNSSCFSGATEDQIYLAFRLALVKTILPKDQTYTIFMDDPFVQYDEKRFCEAVKLLRNYSAHNNCQIIVATCHNRIVPFIQDENVILI